MRAFDPVPGAFCEASGALLKLWCTRVGTAPAPAGTAPGTLLSIDEDGLAVACGSGTLRLLEVQRAGGRRQQAVEYARTAGLSPGFVFGGGLRVLAPPVPVAGARPEVAG